MEGVNVRPSMGLAEDATSAVTTADWINKYVLLGRLAARWSQNHADSQLVIVLSVPVRDFTAVLIGCGWMTETAPPNLVPVREVLASLPVRAPVRVVTRNKVFTDFFGSLDATKDRVRFGTTWQVTGVRAVVPLDSLDEPRAQAVTDPGAVTTLTGMDRQWAERLCSPPQDLALVGTLKRLEEDLAASISWDGEREPIANILLPAAQRAATWSTRVYAASQLEIELPPAGIRAVILDGAPATRYLSAIEAPVVISVLDRSIADESVPESVLNYRNTQGEPVSLERDLGWKPPVGVEALGFEVAL